MTALREYQVLELSEGVSGEYCGKLLADFGAQVIKIERPGAGSPTRLLASGPNKDGRGAGALFAYLNTNKSSVALDLSSDLAKLKALIDSADVLIDDHPSGWLAELGFSPATIEQTHPALVACSITAFGQNPPPHRRHAEDLNVFHASGWGYHTPGGAQDCDPPLKAAGRYLVSYEAALDAATCIMAALFERENSGKGRFIDISKQQVMASRTDYVLGQMITGEMDVSTNRTTFDLGGPSGIFPCQTGFVYFWLSDGVQWEILRQLMGCPAWMDAFPERWLERATTPERVAKCRSELSGWFQTQDRNAVSVEGQKRGLMIVPINDAPDLLESPQYAYRKYFALLDQPGLGKLTVPTTSYKMGLTPTAITSPAPSIGQHTAEKLVTAVQAGNRATPARGGDH